MRREWLAWTTFLLVEAAMALNFLYAPNLAPGEQVHPLSQHLFYIHVGAAWNAAVAFTVVFVASIAYLRSRDLKWDLWAAASAEIGVVFTAITLLTGTIWAKAAWGVWWTWDPKLTTTLILWFLFVAYLLIRESVTSPDTRAVYSAVLGIVAFLDVPVVFLAARWWSSIHPVVITGQGFLMPPSMVLTMVTGFVAFTFLYCYWLWHRTALARVERRLSELRARRREDI
ncbi:MAG: cytochrome c biogenesis protein CcsA [Thermaerobacter sp.]|nr:cytochrome c biogenesis protein CcsA [Thermaerobacter sp.]